MTDVTLRYLLFGDDRTASSSIKGTGTQAQKTSAIVRSSFSKLGASVGGPIGEIVDRIDSMFDTLGEHSSTFGQKMTAGGVGLAGLGAGLSILGSKEKESTNSLQAALGTTGHSINDYKDEIEAAIKSGENYNHNASETQTALATLVESTGSATKALDHMQLVEDVAAAKHLDLNSAAAMVAKTIGGSTRLLQQYGITVQKNADGSKNMDLAISQLSDKLHGQASASVDSYTGHLKVLETKIHDQVSLFGEKFGPVLQGAGAALAVVGTVTQIVANRQLIAATAQEAYAASTEGQTAAAIAQAEASSAQAEATLAEVAASEGATVATEEQTAAQTGLDAAMDANPIGLVVIALAALVAGFVLAYKHSETFRAIVDGAMHDVGAAAAFAGHEFGQAEHVVDGALHGVEHLVSDAVSFTESHWKLMLAILTGPFGAATIFILSHWSQIKGAASDGEHFIETKFTELLHFIGGMPGKVDSAAAGMFHGITSAFESAINGAIDIWNRLHFSIPGVSAFGKHLGGVSIGVPQLPHLAVGGALVTSGSVMVGERGSELLNLPAGASVRPLSASERAGGSADLGTFTVIVQSEDGRVLQRKLLKVKRENGGQKLGLT